MIEKWIEVGMSDQGVATDNRVDPLGFYMVEALVDLVVSSQGSATDLRGECLGFLRLKLRHLWIWTWGFQNKG